MIILYCHSLQGMTLDDALHKVKTARPQAHPYVDCWKVSSSTCTPALQIVETHKEVSLMSVQLSSFLSATTCIQWTTSEV